MIHRTPAQIKSARLKAGLTQPDFAKILNVKTRIVQYWEAGAIKMPQHRWELWELKLAR